MFYKPLFKPSWLFFCQHSPLTILYESSSLYFLSFILFALLLLSLKLVIHRIVRLTYQILSLKPQAYGIDFCILHKKHQFVCSFFFDTTFLFDTSFFFIIILHQNTCNLDCNTRFAFFSTISFQTGQKTKNSTNPFYFFYNRP